MNPLRPKLLHIAPHARGFGGIESVLERHVAIDARVGFDAVQLGLFNRGKTTERFYPMGFGWRHTPRAMRRAMARVCGEHPGSVIFWHNAWGMPWFAEADASIRRIAWLHADRGYFAPWLPALRGQIDGVLTVNPAAAQAAAELLPGFPAERIHAVPLPIEPPAGSDFVRPERAQWVIGCAGRLVRVQKRWERLVPFVRELRRLGANFRLEIVGDGSLRPWLEAQFRGDDAIVFTGLLEKTEYWRRLRDWDAAVFFSDNEGGPLVLLEAMAMGALPIYPRIGGSLGDDYVPQIDPRAYYTAGDPTAAAHAIHAVLSEPLAVRQASREKARALVAPHRPENYESTYGRFVNAVTALPRLGRPVARRRPSWTDVLPLGVITRLFPERLWR